MSMDAGSFKRIAQVVRDESAIVLSEGKEYLVEARLTPVCRLLELGSLDELAQGLTSGNRDLIELVVEALTTNETSFFRDGHPFETLRNEVLPGLLDRRQSERALRVWCGASSSGQEPLTLAMTLLESVPSLSNWDVRIIASDISTEMLERCRSGLYSQLEVSRGLPANLLAKYFQKDGRKWRVRPEVLNLIDYQRINLSRPLPLLPTMDVVFLRNVLIYFDDETKRFILEGVRDQLASDGTLFLGTAEVAHNLVPELVPVSYGRTTCFVRGGSR